MTKSEEAQTNQQTEYKIKTGENSTAQDNTMEEDKGGTISTKTWTQKYGNSLKLLLPIRSNSTKKEYLPSGKSGCLTFASLGWLTSIMLNAYRKGMGKTCNWKLPAEDSSEVNYERLDRLWREEVARRGDKASFPKTVWRFVRTRTTVAIILVFLYSMVNIITPSWQFKEMVGFLETDDRDTNRGLMIVGSIAICQLLRILFYSASWIFSAHTAMRIQGAIKLFLFRKALRLRHRGDKFMSQVIQNITVETDRVFEATSRGISSFSTIVVMTFIIIYSVFTIGWWSLLGVAVLLFAFPLTTWLAKKSAIIRRYAIPYTEERIHIMNEVLTNIRLIKMYAWETPFAIKVADVRNEERRYLQRSAFTHSISQTTSPVICVIAAVAVFLGHTLSGNTMTASEAFSIFALFAAARFALATTTNNAKQIADAIMGCRQMKKLIFAAEVSSEGRFQLSESSEYGILIQSATFSWKEMDESCVDPNEKLGVDNLAFPGACSLSSIESYASVNSTPMLRNLDLRIKKGSLVGVCGSVGSGKSSLLSAIYGDMIILTGQISLNGSLSYVPQQAWVHCGTFQENILFGRPLEKNRYDSVIEACCLVSDINLLPNGDQTEIGERGVNLSGGQRQRINLARALYSDTDVYLFDDPLSAVDTRVAKYIFKNAILRVLKGKTVIMVTHGMHFLERCDHVILLDNNCVEEQGTHKDLLNHGGRYTQIFNFVQANDDSEEAETEDKSEDNPANTINNEGNDVEKGRLVKPEEKQQGQVTFHTYAAYIRASGGFCVALMVFFVFCLHVGTVLFNGIWLQRWLDDGDGTHGTPFQKQLIPADPEEEYEDYLFSSNVPENETRILIPIKHTNIVENPLLWMYALVYGVSVILLVLTGVLQSYFSTLIALIASSKLHDKMFQRVLHCPMSFFDTNPVGRILNRFSKDMDELDYTFPFQLGYVIQYSLGMLGQMALVGVIFPWCIIALVLILVLIMIMDVWFHAGIREMKRLESIARSGVVVQLTSAMQGLSIIRVFGKQNMFIEKFHAFVNEHQKCHMLFYATLLWFAFRVELLCSLLVIITGVLVTFDPDVTPARAGLALAAAFQVTQIITGLIRNKSDLQARFTAVERINEYAKTLPQEQSVVSTKTQIPREWPPDGSIAFKDVSLSYRPGLPLVLKGISCHIKGGEKIGVIGRTGAGKSSLIGTLLRLMEIDSGSITIDGVDISTVPLTHLRSALAVIPQEPVLFQGTIRYNLDPFDEYPDELLWNALAQSNLKEKISMESMQLEAVVDADGDNYSVGEKQLICLARTILRKNKILLLDEATAFVDVETDYKIQKTVRETFADCTILTIAHRLNTIWDSDRILVLDSGSVAEFDSPEVLMNDESSFFRALMLAMGVTQLTNRAINTEESSAS